MKLKRIEVNKFKTIENISIDVDDLSILIGENNSGKSNLIGAIDLFYQETVRGIDEECFCFKECSEPISIILTFDRHTKEEKKQKYLKHWIYNDEMRIKKIVVWDSEKDKCVMTLYAWQASPKEMHFDLSKFDEYKSDIKKIVADNDLPDYFKTNKGTVTQASYKEGIAKHFEAGLVELGDPGWNKNPGGLKEVFSSLLPKFYLVPAVKDAQEESKTTQQTVFGKLITDLTNRIISKNPKFEVVQEQINGLRKFLNKAKDGDESERLQEIIDLESTLSQVISESMPGTKVDIEIVTPELIDLFKDTKLTIDDSLPTSIDAKGHGLQRALIFAYIRAYAKMLNVQEKDGEESSVKNFILGVEEPELYLHPNGQRKMVNVLSNLSASDQVIMSTHSNFFVNMLDYKNIIIVRRENNGPTNTIQYTAHIFEPEDDQEKKRLKKVFRYLSLFDLSRSEMFFAKKVILVEGDTEKFIIPFWASKMIAQDKKHDLSAYNICIAECGGKTNLHIFMRVLNKFKIPYIVIHDVDPIYFPEDKPDKTDAEKHRLRMFNENQFIENTLDRGVGKIICVNPELEKIIGVSRNQADRHGKVGAAYFKYEDMDVGDYPPEVSELLNQICEWDKEGQIYVLEKA